MLQAQIDAKRIIGVKICERLRAEIDKLGFPAGTITDYPYYHLASFRSYKILTRVLAI
jgi:hypothetical protein